MTADVNIDSMLTVNQVANRLNMNPYTVRELLRNGDLKGFKVMNSRWRVRVYDLNIFIERGSIKRKRRQA